MSTKELLLAEIEKRAYNPRDEMNNRALREIAFDWAESLLYELRVEQAANERGACLEGLAAVMEKYVVLFCFASDSFLTLCQLVPLGAGAGQRPATPSQVHRLDGQVHGVCHEQTRSQGGVPQHSTVQWQVFGE